MLPDRTGERPLLQVFGRRAVDDFAGPVQGGVNILADIVAFQLPVKGRVADDVQRLGLHAANQQSGTVFPALVAEVGKEFAEDGILAMCRSKENLEPVFTIGS